MLPNQPVYIILWLSSTCAVRCSAVQKHRVIVHEWNRLLSKSCYHSYVYRLNSFTSLTVIKLSLTQSISCSATCSQLPIVTIIGLWNALTGKIRQSFWKGNTWILLTVNLLQAYYFWKGLLLRRCKMTAWRCTFGREFMYVLFLHEMYNSIVYSFHTICSCI